MMSGIEKENKVILITGAFGLIGLPLSKYFLSQGEYVVLADSNNQLTSNIYRELINLGFSDDSFLLVNIDIVNELSISNAVELSLAKFNKIDVLINNAAIDAKFDSGGISKLNNNSFENYPIELIKKSIEVNTLGTVLVTQKLCKVMLSQGGGNIINVASTYALVSPNQNLYDFGDSNIMFKPVDYIVSKSFIPNFTRYVATFYAKQNIRCNAVAPHGISNNHSKEFLMNFNKLSPIGRMCEVEELFGTFKLLASKDSSYITGETIVVDGGWTSW